MKTTFLHNDQHLNNLPQQQTKAAQALDIGPVKTGSPLLHSTSDTSMRTPIQSTKLINSIKIPYKPADKKRTELIHTCVIKTTPGYDLLEKQISGFEATKIFTIIGKNEVENQLYETVVKILVERLSDLKALIGPGKLIKNFNSVCSMLNGAGAHSGEACQSLINALIEQKETLEEIIGPNKTFSSFNTFSSNFHGAGAQAGDTLRQFLISDTLQKFFNLTPVNKRKCRSSGSEICNIVNTLIKFQKKKTPSNKKAVSKRNAAHFQPQANQSKPSLNINQQFHMDQFHMDNQQLVDVNLSNDAKLDYFYEAFINLDAQDPLFNFTQDPLFKTHPAD